MKRYTSKLDCIFNSYVEYKGKIHSIRSERDYRTFIEMYRIDSDRTEIMASKLLLEKIEKDIEDETIQ